MIDARDGGGTSPSINGRAQEGDTGTTSAKEMEASNILFTALYLEGSLRSARQGLLVLRVMNFSASLDIPCDVIKSCILRNGNTSEGEHLSGGGPRCLQPVATIKN